jgi:hypothetical protein
LVEGRRYPQRISADWRDANGEPLASPADKTFRVAAEERHPVSPNEWRIAAPPAGTRKPLVVTFPTPLDFALLQHTITVAGVAGEITVARNETEWRFTPEVPWRDGEHHLSIATALEDLAGNRVGRVFDVDTFREVTTQITKETTSIPFRVTSSKR